jgi:hypothetical protein
MGLFRQKGFGLRNAIGAAHIAPFATVCYAKKPPTCDHLIPKNVQGKRSLCDI